MVTTVREHMALQLAAATTLPRAVRNDRAIEELGMSPERHAQVVQPARAARRRGRLATRGPTTLLTLGPEDLVFGTPTGKPWNDRNYDRRVFDPAVAAAGVPHGTFYDPRHTAASWLVQAGVDLLVVQALMGHEKYSTTLIYAHLAPGAFGNVLAAWGDTSLDPRATVTTRATETSSTPVTEQDPR